MNDLFRSDMDRLKEHLKTKRFWKTSEIIKWGAMNYSNRANRNKQFLAQRGFLRHMTDEETVRIFGNVKEDGYEVMKYIESVAA